jgi:hypothetical protein
LVLVFVIKVAVKIAWWVFLAGVVWWLFSRVFSGSRGKVRGKEAPAYPEDEEVEK